MASRSVESPEAALLITIPAEYKDYMDMFSKANGFTPHHPYDFRIDLVLTIVYGQ